MTDAIETSEPESPQDMDESTPPPSHKEPKSQRPGHERRRQHPDILTRIARGETEATALAFLNKELALSAAKKVAETDPDKLAES